MKLKLEYNFTGWSTKSLETLLPDYEKTMENVRKMYGSAHSEYKMYVNWVKGMKEELALREMQKQK